jgi:hypothetical protein
MPNGAAQTAHWIWEVAQYSYIDGYYSYKLQMVGQNRRLELIVENLVFVGIITNIRLEIRWIRRVGRR